MNMQSNPPAREDGQTGTAFSASSDGSALAARADDGVSGAGPGTRAEHGAARAVPKAGEATPAAERRLGPPLSELSFPGCAPRRLARRDLDAYEGRLEFWDAGAETAWVCEPTTPSHEEPVHGLAGLLQTIAHVRGSPIKCLGSMDLLVRDPKGEPRRIMQADQSVYLHPNRAGLPGTVAMVVGENDFPDVVLEVDHSTDARRGKLKLYEAWGFPELWIQVPDRPSPSRPRSRLPGLTIYRLERGAYRTHGDSGAFPGWTAAEIAAALDETVPSAATVRVLERVGRTLGERGGTGPDDDPLLRSQRRQAIDHGLEQGIEQGLVHQREQLRRVAERKFGASTTAELAHRLEAVKDPARLGAIGELIIDCATGAELLERGDAT